VKSKYTQKIAFFFLTSVTIAIIIPIILIIFIIIKNGYSVLDLEFLTKIPTDGMRAGGIMPAILGSLIIIAGAVIIAFPIGLFAGIYLVIYAKDNLMSRIIKLAIINLAGVPSVVYGLFGLALFVIYFKFGASILSGCLTLAIMELPVIITSTRTAISSVPSSFYEVSLSLGASKWQTIRHVILPNSISGILTGAILSIARTAGETAPLLFTCAAFYLPHLPNSIFDQVMALPYHLYIISTQIPNIPSNTRYGTALVLISLVIILNIFAIIFRSIYRKKRRY
jgi:phosphate transport system permease protein